MIDTLKSKLLELNNLSQSLNDQLEQLRQQLDENRPRSSLSSFSGSDTDVTEFMSDQESFFDDSNDGFDNNFVSDNNSDTDAAVIDNVTNRDSDSVTGDIDTPVNDVIEQVEVTVVNSLFDLSSRLERVRDEMRSVLNTGTVAENNNLTEGLGMRSARIDDIIDNMSRSINDNSVCANRNDIQTDTARDIQDSNRIVSSTSYVSENLVRTNELNNNMYVDQHHAEVEAQSDHSYVASDPEWQSPRNYCPYSDRSHSEASVYDQDHTSNQSYSSTLQRNSAHSCRSYSGQDSRSVSPGLGSRSVSPAGSQYSEHRSNTSHPLYRSPSHSSRYSPASSPGFHSSQRSVRSPSISSDRNHNQSWSNYSETPQNSNDQISEGTPSPRSPASGNWFSDIWQSDNRESDESRHSEDYWSHRSRSSISHRSEGNMILIS